MSQTFKFVVADKVLIADFYKRMAALKKFCSRCQISTGSDLEEIRKHILYNLHRDCQFSSENDVINNNSIIPEDSTITVEILPAVKKFNIHFSD